MTATFPSKRLVELAAVVLLAAAVAGCSSVVDNIPSSVGGLPEGTPQRSASPVVFPSVHDMPPARPDGALTEAESKRLREELKNTRNRVTHPEATGTTSGNAGSARNP
jgi:hypothetical protein